MRIGEPEKKEERERRKIERERRRRGRETGASASFALDPSGLDGRKDPGAGVLPANRARGLGRRRG